MKTPKTSITRLRRWREVTAALIATTGIALAAVAATAHNGNGAAHKTAIGSVGYQVSHAAPGTDDYPSYWKNHNQDAFGNSFGLNRECVSFVAWKVYEANGGTQVPSGEAAPTDGTKLSIDVPTWGVAWEWGYYARNHHYAVSTVPTVGSVAWWDKTGVWATHGTGHVAYVTAASATGFDIAQYNIEGDDGAFSTAHFALSNGRLTSVTNTTSSGPLAGRNLSWIPMPNGFITVPAPSPTGGGTQPPMKDLTLRVADASLAGHYASARLNNSDVVQAYATAAGPWERFTFIPVPGKAGAYYLKSQATGKYLSARFNLPGNQRGTLYATAASPGPWETFYEQHVGADQAFYVYDNSGAKWYVSTEMNDGGLLRARTTPAAFTHNVDHGSWELFSVGS